MPMLPQLQKMWESMVRSPTFGRVLDKCVLVKASNGTSIAEMTVGEEHTNAVGTLHGGMTATLVDIVSGFGLCTHPKHPAIGVTVDLHISYMAPANIGDVIVIESTTNKVGKTLAFLDIVVKNKTNGKLVAKGSHTKYIDVPNRINT